MEDFSCPSECEEVEGKDSQDTVKLSGVAKLSVVWSGSARKTPLILFRADAILGLDGPQDHLYTGPNRLTFKIAGNEYRLVRTILLSHGFSEVSCGNARFNLYWSGTHVQMSEVRGLMPHQRLNHFPRSYMITRKDRLYQNIARMQQSKGMKHFNIIPTTFALPEEMAQFQVAFRKQRGVWIEKPVSSSRGRGISIINHPNQVNKDEPMVVSHYIDNPLCVNGYKFDLRIYVAVTSFNPLKIYLYEEGLARFATEQYSGAVQLNNLCMHLTNYSVNKKSAQYVRCENPGRDDYGSKWSMSALLRHLHKEGRDVAEMMMKVEDVVIKALIAGGSHISAACDVFQTHRGNCFELYGFDILIDETLRPWLLEVNLSPSLGCDAPLDLRLKSNLVADLLTLVGVPLCNPYTRETPKPPKSHPRPAMWSPKRSSMRRLTSEEVSMVRDCREEYGRRGGFVRIFPSHDSWDLYSSFLESKGRLNFILHHELYSDRVKASHSPASLSTIIAKRVNLLSTQPPGVCDSPDGMIPLERVAVYLRKLENRPKVKPMWDSVQELFWHKNLSSLPGGGFEMTTKAESTPLSSSTCTSNPPQCLIPDVTRLSKVQARKLFAAYLDHVQKRLIQEAGDVIVNSQASEDTANFEMVISFLKRAARSLPSPFTLVVPNVQLPVKDRKGMLARQLAEFITLYNKETDELATNPTEVPGLPAKVVDGVLPKASERDLEKLLAAYARHSHSSAVLFGTVATAQKPTQPINHTTSSQRLTKDSPLMPTTANQLKPSVNNRFLPKSSRHVLSRHAMSRVLQRQSRVPRAPLSSGSQQGFQTHSSTTTTGRTTPDSSTHVQRIAVDVPVSPPPYDTAQYSDELLQTSSLPPRQKRSLRVLTQSLAAGRRLSERGRKAAASSVSGGLPPRGPNRVMQGQSATREGRQERNGGTKNGRLLRRTLSSQSLQSNNSEASVQSLKSAQSFGAQLQSSIDKTPIKVGRPQSACLVSRMKNYVSPYAQPVRKKSLIVQKNSSTTQSSSIPRARQRESSFSTGIPHGTTKPPVSEDSLTEALHRLTLRQKMTAQHTCPAASTRPTHSRVAWTSETSTIQDVEGLWTSETSTIQDVEGLWTSGTSTIQDVEDCAVDDSTTLTRPLSSGGHADHV